MPQSLGKRLLQKEKAKAKKQAEGEAEEEKGPQGGRDGG